MINFFFLKLILLLKQKNKHDYNFQNNILTKQLVSVSFIFKQYLKIFSDELLIWKINIKYCLKIFLNIIILQNFKLAAYCGHITS